MATSSNEMKVVIDPLNGSNYQSWKFNVKLILMDRGLWGIVSGVETAPKASDEDKKEKEIKEFLLRSQKAYSQIALTVKKDLQIHVANTDDPKKAWDQLKKHFEFVSVTHTVRVNRAFYAAKMAENGNLMDHITYMTQLAEQLREMKDEVSPQKFAVVVLGSLPDSYDTFLTSLNARNVDDLTWDEIKPSLIEEYMKKKDKQERQNSDDALFVRGNSNNSHVQQNRGYVNSAGRGGRGGSFRSNYSDRNNRGNDTRPPHFNTNHHRGNNRGEGLVTEVVQNVMVVENLGTLLVTAIKIMKRVIL